MSAEKAARQRFAIIVGEGLVRAVGEVTGWTVHGDRIALEGHVLAEGHPVRDTYLGKPDPVDTGSQNPVDTGSQNPVDTGSQNPVGYCALPEEQQFVQRPCACGCDKLTDRDFLPGHDVRAMQARVRIRRPVH